MIDVLPELWNRGTALRGYLLMATETIRVRVLLWVIGLLLLQSGRASSLAAQTVKATTGLVSSKAVVLNSRTGDRKSTRLNSSHLVISYAVFCLKKKSTLAARVPFVLDLPSSFQNSRTGCASRYGGTATKCLSFPISIPAA